ncbi:hypothetical protein [Blastococcus sp. VKM Ac-2987]|uniref:hypothetical protein n=1 Tax=Blastococcus sp. VKM Ac-2987 TaxID=3004141 RepID=UPI0022AB79C2|nr:hypothetical protein [Blastococcus sp. VKM Ac-2987]MCZ2857689.1 hypothetical protein [Blastococcus sp. VKM Ac-2987]
MSGPALDPQDRARLEAWYKSLSGRHVNRLHDAVGHSTTSGPAPRLGKALMAAALVLCVGGAVVLGLAGFDNAGAVYLLPFVALAGLGSLLVHGLSPGYQLTDELLVSLWEADQRLSGR